MRNLEEIFVKHFGTKPILVRAPGRINLIGEHIDYNDGIVLPVAIDKYIYIALQKNNVSSLRLYSVQFDESAEVKLSDRHPQRMAWVNYVVGVVDQVLKLGQPMQGFDMVIDGNIPSGAGLSSSAALECAVAMGLTELFGHTLTRKQMAFACQHAEQAFAGVQCGIMDQYASMFGKQGHAIKLDCRSVDHVHLPLNLKEVEIVLFDTQVKHALASSEYNTRRVESDQAWTIIHQKFPTLSGWRDVSQQHLHCLREDHPILYKRALFIVEEIFRVVQACAHLEAGNIQSLGKQLVSSHAGLRDLYQVSCAELDFLVDTILNEEGVLGSRMMGGGFGGCTINLIQTEVVEAVIARVGNSFASEFGRGIIVYKVQSADGAHRIT